MILGRIKLKRLWGFVQPERGRADIGMFRAVGPSQANKEKEPWLCP